MVWSQSICIFLKGRKLWLYVTGEVKNPVKGTSELDEALVLLIGIVSIVKFLRGSVTPLSHLFLRSLTTLMKQRVLEICLLFVILLWIVPKSIGFCLSFSI
jgi:hypothetical protein